MNNKHQGQIKANGYLAPARGQTDQLDMKSRVRCCFLFGLVALLQFGRASSGLDKDQAIVLQLKVENLIEKVIDVIQNYYRQIRTEMKCIPETVPDLIIGTIKKSIECVDKNEREYNSGNITAKGHKKAFLNCFATAKKEVEETIMSIDPNVQNCPANVTEKTYQINVTTTFTKTFQINIRNGLEVVQKSVEMSDREKSCVFSPDSDTWEENDKAVVPPHENAREDAEEADELKTHSPVGSPVVGISPERGNGNKNDEVYIDGYSSDEVGSEYRDDESNEHQTLASASGEYKVEEDNKNDKVYDYDSKDEESSDNAKSSASKEHRVKGHEFKKHHSVDSALDTNENEEENAVLKGHHGPAFKVTDDTADPSNEEFEEGETDDEYEEEIEKLHDESVDFPGSQDKRNSVHGFGSTSEDEGGDATELAPKRGQAHAPERTALLSRHHGKEFPEPQEEERSTVAYTSHKDPARGEGSEKPLSEKPRIQIKTRNQPKKLRATQQSNGKEKIKLPRSVIRSEDQARRSSLSQTVSI